MTKPRSQMKKLPTPSMQKQLAATGLIVISGLLIFLIIGLIAPKSTNIIDAGREFDTQPYLPSLGPDLPLGLSAITFMMPAKSPSGPLNLDLTRGFILSDHDKRIPASLKIPDSLKKETALYFDLITKYSRDSWLIISDDPYPSVVEEWSAQKLESQIIPPITNSKISGLLNSRMVHLVKTHQGLRIQRGLREKFLAQMKRQKRWLPIIENMFRKQGLPMELTRFFLVPNNISLDEVSEPWTSLKPKFVDRYLLKNTTINETRSPLKVARALLTVLKKQKPRTIRWNTYFDSPSNLDAVFFAALYADIYWDELQLEKSEVKDLAKVNAFKLARQTSIGDLAQQLNIDLPIFYESNPDLIKRERQVILPKTYVFFVTK